eukprot:11150419-Ditylum_brightwellii.AAC.1
MKIGWDKKSGEMRFSVFWKPNQGLKYVNRASTYRPTTFKSTASGFFTRLARPTSNIATNGRAQINKLYPDHAKALFTADLALPTDFPTFQELWQDNEKQRNEPIKPKRSKQDQHLVYFVIGHSSFLS